MSITGDNKVARRYAGAFFDAVSVEGGPGVEAAASDLNVIAYMLEHVPYLRAVLMQPMMSDEHKRKIVADAFQSRVGPTTLNLLLLLIRKRRESVIEAVIADFLRLADERAGRLDAFVEASMELSDEQQQRLQQALEQRTGKHVQLHASVNAGMLGGLRVRIGDSVIDGGLSTRLDRIKRQLLAAR